MKWAALILMINFSTAWGQQLYPILWLDGELPESHILFEETHLSANIPFEQHGGLLLVNAFVNGAPGRFIFDTGSPSIIVNRLPLHDKDSTLAFGFNQLASFQKIKIKTFEWASLLSNNIDAYAIDLQYLEALTNKNLMGVIGYEGLQAYEIVLDFKENAIVLRPGGKKYEDHELMTEAPVQMVGHLPVITLQINGKKYRFGLDTGAAVNVIDEKTAKALESVTQVLPQTAALSGIGGHTTPAAMIKLSKVELQGSELFPLTFCTADMSTLNTATDFQIDGLLGLPFFKVYKTAIDFKKEKVLFRLP